MPILFLLQQLLTTTTITAEISASLCILDTHNRGPNLYDAIFILPQNSVMWQVIIRIRLLVTIKLRKC